MCLAILMPACVGFFTKNPVSQGRFVFIPSGLSEAQFFLQSEFDYGYMNLIFGRISRIPRLVHVCKPHGLFEHGL